MFVAWNSHMQKVFTSSWISCLDEYMFLWMNKFTCPGFVLFSCEPHSKGNDYHIICCCESGIMLDWYIVEGRYYPVPMG